MIIGAPENAVKLLKDGNVIGYPTEAVYGLGCDPWNEKAVAKIAGIKKRSVKKTFIIVASNINQLRNLIDVDIISKKAKLSWPGHTTWLMPARQEVAPWLIDVKTRLVGVRVSNHPIIQRLCESFGGPIISTSANISGGINIKEQNIFISEFESTVDYLVEGDIGNQDEPSKIINMMTNEILR